MKVAVRVDASNQIGTGHLIRCLTLADRLKQQGAQVRFVSRHLPESFRSMLIDKGHEFILLENVNNDVKLDELAHANWLGVSQAQDATDSIQTLSDQTWDWLVVDHYALDFRWESMLRQVVKRILTIDDLADRQHDCDILLDQNYYTDLNSRYRGKVPSFSQLFLGPCYALLRDEFLEIREQIKPRSGRVNRVLVSLGGIDVGNYTKCVVDALSEVGILGLHVDVVIGTQHPSREQIKAACTQNGFICHIQTDKMAELMRVADLAIGGGGGGNLGTLFNGITFDCFGVC